MEHTKNKQEWRKLTSNLIKKSRLWITSENNFTYSIKGSFLHEYQGDREKEEMVNYALRMSQSAVQRLTHADSLGDLKESHPVFFGFTGKQQGPLWVGNKYCDYE